MIRSGSRLDRDRLRAFAESERPRFEKLLGELVGIRTVSAEPELRKEILRGVDLAVEIIEKFGGRATVHRPPRGNPLVLGEFTRGGRLPTVTVYNHLDVQPASRESGDWRTDPFLLTRKGFRYYGRGATDDKGPALSALLGIRAAREAGLPLNVRLLWEFEEEIGSPSFEGILRAARGRLGTKAVLVSDTVWLSRRIPASPAGLRGFQGFRFSLSTARTDLHSGEVGGAARNPLAELMALMCRMHDPGSGRIKIPGFHDDVLPPGRNELESFASSGFSLGTFKRDLRLRRLRTEDPAEVMRRIWVSPTFEVHGVRGGYAGPGMKAIVPGRAEVIASCRLVPNQRPARIFKLVKAFAKSVNPDVRVEPAGSAVPFLGVTTGPYADAIREAVRFGFGRPPVFIRDGGSIGAVVTMRKILRCPVLFLGLSLPEDGYHAPNESFDWRQAAKGIAAFARCFEILSSNGS
jgi:acetylornithine deacetylase/succinyl-diaminopimelate desuccinylase-like protein